MGELLNHFVSLFSVAALLAGRALGASLGWITLSDDALQNASQGDETAGGIVALMSQPLCFFGRANGYPSCYPTHAVDEYGNQTKPAPLCEYPDVSCGCRDPDVGIGHEGPSFPIYYSIKKCKDDEIRVAYNLFYEKTGFAPGPAFGHEYDWQTIIAVWRRGVDGTKKNDWRPYTLMLSRPYKYEGVDWTGLRNSFDTWDAGKRRGGEPPKGGPGIHPKVFVGWARHTVFQDENQQHLEMELQLTPHAFRSNDWWYFPQWSDYIKASADSDMGKVLAGLDWGSAKNHPAKVDEELCDIMWG